MNKQFNKVIVWGHKLKSARTANTFAFIHNAWYKTFKYMGYDVLWLDDDDDVSGVNFENCLFLTEGQADEKMPVVQSSKYVFHNCFDLHTKYASVVPNCLNIGPYNSHLRRRKAEKLDGEDLAFYQPEPDFTPNEGCDNRTLHQPWATDLLPDEIDPENPLANKYHRQNRIFWVGSVCGGEYGNVEELSAFSRVSAANNIPFIHAKLENDMAPRAISESFIAPAIQGREQVRIEYVPCRVFKNISYGRMTGTNSEFVYKLFGEKIPYSTSMDQLFHKSVDWEKNGSKEDLKQLMKYVKEKHTYVNRVTNILKVL